MFYLCTPCMPGACCEFLCGCWELNLGPLGRTPGPRFQLSSVFHRLVLPFTLLVVMNLHLIAVWFVFPKWLLMLNSECVCDCFVLFYCSCLQTPQKRASDLIRDGCELHVLLGFELRTFGRAISAFNHRAISPVLFSFLKT